MSDVSVERTGAGSLLLYRLLKDYPTDALRIVFNPGHSQGGDDVRLRGVRYVPLAYAMPRVLRNRLNPFWPVVLSAQTTASTSRVLGRLEGFAPEAVLSVANGFLWFTAASLARKLDVPFHLFLHEDWPNLVTANRPGRIWDLVRLAGEKRVGPLYRRAPAGSA